MQPLQKPLDIGHPEILTCQSDTMKGFVALAVQSQLCDTVESKDIVLYGRRPLGSVTSANGDSEPGPGISVGLQHMPLYQPDALPEPTRWVYVGRAAGAQLRAGEALPCGVGLVETPHWRELMLTPLDIVRIERAAEFRRTQLGSSIHSYEKLQQMQLGDSIPLVHKDYDLCLADKGNIKFGSNGRYRLDVIDRTHSVFLVGTNTWAFSLDSNLPMLFAAVLSGVYGGIHLTAWGSEFPTRVEGVLWKASGIVSSVIIPVTAVCGLMMALLDDFLQINMRVSAFSLMSVLFVVNVAARVFLTVESFVSIRSLPVGAYVMPAWLQMLPHL